MIFMATSASWSHKAKLKVFVVSMSALKNFSLFELKDAINGGNIIGEGGSCKVYKVLSMLVISNLLAIMSPRETLYYIRTTKPHAL